jgi:transcriptional regulator with XRE-family HTH domain
MSKDLAIELRQQGFTYSLISKKLGVSGSTLSYWLRDIPYTPNLEVQNRIKNGSKVAGLKRHKQRIENTQLAHSEARQELGVISNRDLFMLGIRIIYWRRLKNY